MKHSEIKVLINKTIGEADKVSSITDWLLDGHFTWKIVDGDNIFLGRVNAVIEQDEGNIHFTYRHDRRTYDKVARVKSIDINISDLDSDGAYNKLVEFDAKIIAAHKIGGE